MTGNPAADSYIRNIDYLDLVIDAARRKLRDKLAADADFFGQDAGVKRRIPLTLDEIAPKGTLALRENIDANAAAGIMRVVDLTILNHDAKTDEVKKIARRAAREHCATVCTYPEHVPIVSRVMREQGITDVPPIALVGHLVPAPTAEATAQTVQQTRNAIARGSREIDTVFPTNFREDGSDHQDHFKYIKAVVDAAHEDGIPVKVILETAYLNDRQIAEASILSKIAGADWVKTSTGYAEIDKFAKGKGPTEIGATPHVVALMRRAVGDTTLDDRGNEKPMGVKASGGLRTRDQVVAVLQAGADRIGASGGIDVRTEAEKTRPDDPVSSEGRSPGLSSLAY